MKGMVARTACLLALLFAGCRERSGGAPPANAVEKDDWGEDAALVPDFILPQERRAPKMPDAEKRWKELASPTEVGKLDGLLICKVEVAAKYDPSYFPWGSGHPPIEKRGDGTVTPSGGDWDSLNGPDTLFRFRFGDARPIQLWGPEDHWQMFISIPRLTVERGAPVRIDVWDRDVTTREYISTVETSFAGKFPWRMEAKYLRFDCRALDEARARELARPWREKLEAAIARIEAARPDPAPLDFGTPVELDELQDNWRWRGGAIFRYYAGYLGWEDPEVHALLLRYSTAQGAWHGRLQATLEAIAADSPRPGQWGDSGDGWSLRVARVRCEEGGECVAVETRGASPSCKAVDASGPARLGNLGVYWVTSDGTAELAYAKQLDAQGHAVDCDGRPAHRFLLTIVPEHLALIRLQGGSAPRFLRAR
jgi:hypothetical protein